MNIYFHYNILILALPLPGGGMIGGWTRGRHFLDSNIIYIALPYICNI